MEQFSRRRWTTASPKSETCKKECFYVWAELCLRSIINKTAFHLGGRYEPLSPSTLRAPYLNGLVLIDLCFLGRPPLAHPELLQLALMDGSHDDGALRDSGELSFQFLSSVTRLGSFLNFLATDFITKVAQMFGGFLGSCEKHCFSIQTGYTTFWVTFGKKLGYFLFQHLVTLDVMNKF